MDRILEAYAAVGAGAAVGLNDDEIADLRQRSRRPRPLPLDRRRSDFFFNVSFWALAVLAAAAAVALGFISVGRPRAPRDLSSAGFSSSG